MGILEKLLFFRADMAGLGKYHMGGYGRIGVYRVNYGEGGGGYKIVKTQETLCAPPPPPIKAVFFASPFKGWSPFVSPPTPDFSIA